jgi:hypothetical protein
LADTAVAASFNPIMTVNRADPYNILHTVLPVMRHNRSGQSLAIVSISETQVPL